MQESLWLLTLALVLLLALIFFAVIRQAQSPLASGQSIKTGRYRQPLFWALVVIGSITTYATLARWPHTLDTKIKDSPVRVNAIAEQWSWNVDHTELPLNKPIEFAVTSRDVNHGFGVYNSDLKLLTQIQAMPGYINRVYYTFTKPGKYRVLCMEYCGLVHHDMLVELTVMQ